MRLINATIALHNAPSAKLLSNSVGPGEIHRVQMIDIVVFK